MRALEWLFLLSFIPILVMPFVAQRWRRGWVMVSALLPVLVGGLHMFVEGWRVQMIPLYGFALLALASRLPAMVGREGTVRRGRGIAVSVVSMGILIGCGILAGWLLPVMRLPEPTGPYAVGILDRELVDTARDRRLMVSVWYPAAETGSPAPLTHYPDEVTTALGNLAGLPGMLFQQMRYITLNASAGVPVLVDGAPFPVLVFSPGIVGLRLQNSSTMQELASWGYVVVAIDHTDAAAVTVFPDGEVRFYDLEAFGIPTGVEPTVELVTERVFPVWVADQRFVYDVLEMWSVDDPLLAGKLDLTRIGSFGHSFGGATALEVCRVDARCGAAVNLDGGLYGETITQPAVRPVMLMTSAESTQYAESVDEWAGMIENADGAAYWAELHDSTHFSFTITQLLSPILVPDGFDPRAGLRIVDQYVRGFFDLYLRGVESVPLGSATDVRWIEVQ